MDAFWSLTAAWLALSGLSGFSLMGFDKRRAREGGRRIPERTFFALALIGGVFGILAGTGFFHHKNRKWSFLGVVLVCALLWVGGLVVVARLIGPPAA